MKSSFSSIYSDNRQRPGFMLGLVTTGAGIFFVLMHVVKSWIAHVDIIPSIADDLLVIAFGQGVVFYIIRKTASRWPKVLTLAVAIASFVLAVVIIRADIFNTSMH